MKKLIFILILISLLLSTQCLALRVSGKNVVDFEPNLEKSFKLCITILKYDREAHLSVKGALGEYVTLDEEIIKFDRPDTKCTRYHLKLPSEVDVFGKRAVYINVREINPNPGDGAFSLIPTMNHPLVVMIPYPGKYLSGSFGVKDVKEGEIVPMGIELSSKGKNTVESADSIITIFDVNNNSIATLKPPTVYELLPGNSSTIEIEWNSTGWKSGRYRAEAKVSYSNMTLEMEKEFHIGSLSVEVLHHTKNMTNGSIKPVKVTIQSKWTDPIGEVFLDITVNNKKTTTPHKKIDPWTPTNYVGYIDATDFKVGNASLKVVVHYSNKKTEYEGNIEIIPHPIVEEGFDFGISITTVLIVVIALLVALNIVWFIFYRRRKNKNKIDDHAHQVTLTESFKDEKK